MHYISSKKIILFFYQILLANLTEPETNACANDFTCVLSGPITFLQNYNSTQLT